MKEGRVEALGVVNREDIMCLSVVCPTSNTWGSMGERRGIDMS